MSGLKLAAGAAEGRVLTSDASGLAVWQALPVQDHGSLNGLADDDHAQYVMGSGRPAGQAVTGSTAPAGTLTLRSTSDPTKGKILLGSGSAFDEANDRLGLGNAAPSEKLEVAGRARFSDQVISTLATGTAPLSVQSSTAVTNLNADMVDGSHAADFAAAQHAHPTSDLTSGTLSAARGGTGQSSYVKGDLLVASGATALERVGVGSDGQVLRADSTQATGVRWATGSALQECWRFSPSSSQTFNSTTWTNVTGAEKQSLACGGRTSAFTLGVGYEAVAAHPTRLGFFRLEIYDTIRHTTAYLPDANGFDFVSPYNLVEVASQSHTFVASGTTLPASDYRVRLQAKLNTAGDQFQVSANCYLSCSVLEV